MPRHYRHLQLSFVGGELSPGMHGRIPDVKYQNGLAAARNVLITPQGPAPKRPGTAHVGASKTGSGRTWLYPFRYSTTQAYALQFGRATVDSRSIGYIRFHANGGTLQYATPRDYVAPQDAADLNLNTEVWTFGSAHGYQVGDPVVLTTTHRLPAPLVASTIYYAIVPSGTTLKLAATFANALADVPIGLGGVACTFNDGANQVNSTAHGLLVDERVTFAGGGLPVEIVAGTTYFVRAPAANTFELSLTPGGPQLNFSAGAGGAYDLVSARFHYAYEPGDLTKWLGAGPGNFYAMGRPWDTHADHAPTDTTYWYREPADLTYEVPHFYAQAILGELTFAQSSEALVIGHRDRPMAELRRLGTTRWVLSPVTPATIAVPTNPQAVATRGESYTIAGATIATPSVLGTTVEVDKVLPQNQAVYLEAGVGNIPAGLYRTGPRTGLTNFQVTLVTVDGGNNVPSAVAGVVGTPRMWPTSLSSEQSTDYVVTAVDALRRESSASAVASVTNNLFVTGASNTVSWTAVAGAVRYRVYKKQTGLFGYIGEVDAALATSFKDDSIGPDLGITPPTFDNSLLVSGTVTFDVAVDRVNWTAHGRAENDPVIFSTGGTLPTNVELGVTYYVRDPKPDSFQIAAEPGGAAIDIQTGAMAGAHAATSGHFPGAVGYFEQRRWACGAWTEPQKAMASRSGTESDFSYHIPTEDSDRISHRIAARENHTIRHVVPLGHLLLLTSEGEYRVSPVNEDALTPDSFSARAESYVGAGAPQPVVVNGAVLFAGARGGHIYEAGFTQAGRLITASVALRAAHLFDGLEVEQIALSRAPLQIAWCVSSSGVLLGLTYVPEQEVGAWHVQETDGIFESVCVVPEGDEDRVYVAVRRTVNGATVRHIERMATQKYAALADAFFVDDGLAFDGTNTSAVTITPTATSYLLGQTVTLTASAPTFAFPATTDVGDEIRLTRDGVVHKVRITATSSTTVATGRLLQTLPVNMRGVATTAWAWARDSFSGLSHLEGAAVAVLADGVVVRGLTVASGAIALPSGTLAQKLAVGLPFTGRLRTLPLGMQTDAALGSGRSKNVTRVWLRVDNSGAFRVGPAGALDDSSLPPSGQLHTGQVQVTVAGSWNDDGQIDVEQSDPLPLTAVGLTIEVASGD